MQADSAPGTKLLINNLRLFFGRLVAMLLRCSQLRRKRKAMAGGDRQGATTDHSLSYGRKEQRSMGEKEPKELVKNFVPGTLEQRTGSSSLDSCF
jgi:hypothetical protein